MTSDPLRSDTPPAIPPPDVEREAKIEQLLLAGLDHYFASQYEQAINIWTRALFFDRNHPRARAYIERARRAQAERQRESEELLHNGAVAYRRGDGREARRLLQAALAAGVALLLMVAVGTYVVVSSRGEWRPWSSLAGDRAMSTSAPTVREVAFNVPTAGEMALASARTSMSRGDLHAALSALERVRPTDPMKREVDRLRAGIQRRLLRSVSDSPADSAAGDAGAAR